MIVFDPSYLGLVLSLRDVALRTRTWCLEVALEIFGVTFQMSRGRFKIFISWCPEVCFTSLRGLELRTGTWCPEVASDTFGVTFSVSRGRFRNLHFEVFRGWT